MGTVSWGPGPSRVAAAGGLGCGALTLLPVAQHVLSRAQTISLPHLCNVLLAFARLNFRPEQEEPFFSLVRSSHPPPPPPSLPSPHRGGGGVSGLSAASCAV